MNKQFKPALAVAIEVADLPELKYPLLLSRKIDGVRVLVRNGELLTRNLTPVINKQLQAQYRTAEGYDGELVVGEANAHDVFLRTVSLVKRADAEYDPATVQFLAFDCTDAPPCATYRDRWTMSGPYGHRYMLAPRAGVVRLAQMFCKTPDDVLKHYRLICEEGYEGVVLRALHSTYKHGRYTVSEQGMLKLKPRDTGGAMIIGCTESQHNTNPLIDNPLGRAKRSSAASGRVGRGTLGAFRVLDDETGIAFDIGTGFTDAQRSEIWATYLKSPSKIAGLRVRYQFQKSGSKKAPRFPVFAGFIDYTDPT